MNKKALFFDIDGTIFEAGKPGISPAVIEAINHTQALGHLCFVASGRPYQALPDFVTEIGFDGYICGNGTQAVLNHQLIYQKCLNFKKSKTIIKLIETLNLEYIILTTEQSGVSAHHDELFDYYKQYHVDTDAILTQYHLDDLLMRAIKIETMTHHEHERQLIKETAENLGFFAEIKNDGYIELSDKTVTKGTALAEMCKAVDIPVSESIVFGDGLNDLDMFLTAGYRIAMDNAVDQIKQIADEITLSVNKDGVAFSLKKLFKI